MLLHDVGEDYWSISYYFFIVSTFFHVNEDYWSIFFDAPMTRYGRRLFVDTFFLRVKLGSVVETGCWIFRACFSHWTFQQDFRPESYEDLSSCWIPVLQISAISWNSAVSKRSLDQRSNFYWLHRLSRFSPEIGAGWLGSDENRIFIDSRQSSSVVRFSVSDLPACEYLGPESMWIRWPTTSTTVRVTPTSDAYE